MEAQALKKYIRSSPRKMRLVIDLIRGKKAEEAISILRFVPKMAALDAVAVVKSAVSNLQNKAKDADEMINDSDIYVKAIYVNNGPAAKRILPAPMGRAYRIKKRTNHLTVVVATVDNEHSNKE